MHVSIFPKFGAKNSVPVFNAIKQGLQALGIKVTEHNLDADIAVIWSVVWAGRMQPNQQVWHHFQNQNKPVLVAEVGMINRNITWKLGINGTNLHSYPNTDFIPNRSKYLQIKLSPWQSSGRDVVIALQRTDSEQWQGQPDIVSYVEHCANTIKQHTDREILIRPHPRYKYHVPKGCKLVKPVMIPNTYDDFDFLNVLSNAWCVVNWNSGPGVISAVNGVPVFVGPDSLASRVGNLELGHIETPARPDRQSWVEFLAHTEWTIEEIANGVALRRLLQTF